MTESHRPLWQQVQPVPFVKMNKSKFADVRVMTFEVLSARPCDTEGHLACCRVLSKVIWYAIESLSRSFCMPSSVSDKIGELGERANVT